MRYLVLQNDVTVQNLFWFPNHPRMQSRHYCGYSGSVRTFKKYKKEQRKIKFYSINDELHKRFGKKAAKTN